MRKVACPTYALYHVTVMMLARVDGKSLLAYPTGE